VNRRFQLKHHFLAAMLMGLCSFCLQSSLALAAGAECNKRGVKFFETMEDKLEREETKLGKKFDITGLISDLCKVKLTTKHQQQIATSRLAGLFPDTKGMRFQGMIGGSNPTAPSIAIFGRRTIDVSSINRIKLNPEDFAFSVVGSHPSQKMILMVGNHAPFHIANADGIIDDLNVLGQKGSNFSLLSTNGIPISPLMVIKNKSTGKTFGYDHSRKKLLTTKQVNMFTRPIDNRNEFLNRWGWAEVVNGGKNIFGVEEDSKSQSLTPVYERSNTKN
jgi:hypothetical protein